MLVTLAGILTDDKALQDANAESPMVANLEPVEKINEVKEPQLWNADAPIATTFAGMMMVLKPKPLNARLPSFVNVNGKLIELKLVPENALLPIVSSIEPLPNVTDVRELQPLKAKSPIKVTAAGTANAEILVDENA
jgi:hypothetical protein